MWWLFFIVAGVLGQIEFRLGLATNPTLADLQNLSVLSVFNDAWVLVGAVLAILVLRKVSAFQDERYRLMLGKPAPPAAAAAAVTT